MPFDGEDSLINVKKQKNIIMKEGGNFMKQKYLSPEFEITILTTGDILMTSDEVEMDGNDGLFDEI